MKERIYQHIRSGEEQQAFDELLTLSRGTALFKQALNLSNQYKTYKTRSMMRLILPQEAVTEHNQLIYSLLELSTQLNNKQQTGSESQFEDQLKQHVDLPEQKKVLFLTATPTDMARLALEDEFRQVHQRLQNSINPDTFRLYQAWAVTANALQENLLKYQPDILHFSGHGQAGNPLKKQEGGILLQNDNGKAQLLSSEALLKLIELIGQQRQVKVLLLNACYTEGQAITLSQLVPYVIGMKNAIDDRSAIAFSSGFYLAISQNKSIEYAFSLGKNRIDLENLPDSELISLHRKEEKEIL